jgi:hypothetical protein
LSARSRIQDEKEAVLASKQGIKCVHQGLLIQEAVKGQKTHTSDLPPPLLNRLVEAGFPHLALAILTFRIAVIQNSLLIGSLKPV